MDEEIKVDYDRDLFAFVEALGRGGEGRNVKPESDGQQQQQQQQSSSWSVAYEPSDRATTTSSPKPSNLPPRWGNDACTSTSSLGFDTYTEITDAFDSWLTCLIDVGTNLTSAKVFKRSGITQTVNQMLEDRLIEAHDALDLKCIGNTWMRLLNSYQLYRAGCRRYRRKIISCLLELVSAHQISEDLCTEIFDQL